MQETVFYTRLCKSEVEGRQPPFKKFVDFFSPHRFQTGSGAHPASYSVGTMGKATGE